MKGKVYMVGSGPGNPKMLTLRALEVLRDADFVIYDRLVTPEILDLIPESTIKVRADKTGECNESRQPEINRLMVSNARLGRIVVRLKGGDPFLFARGGDEAEALAAEGIEFEVVPGVSSALAVPAYGGIPLTHRKFSSSIAIVTGNEDPLKTNQNVKWSLLALSVDTIVILMGIATLDKVSRELIKGGLNPKTPVAAVEWGTTDKQKTTLFTLKTAAEGKLREQLNPPGVIIIGNVVSLAKELRWFSKEIYSVVEPLPKVDKSNIQL